MNGNDYDVDVSTSLRTNRQKELGRCPNLKQILFELKQSCIIICHLKLI